MKCRVISGIKTPEELGVAILGDPRSAIVPIEPQNRVDRADYGRSLAKAEGGFFTPIGYCQPVNNRLRRKSHVT